MGSRGYGLGLLLKDFGRGMIKMVASACGVAMNAKGSMDGEFLSVSSPDGNNQVPIGNRPITIGRHPENVLVLRDSQASRFHCVIERSPRGWVLRDLDSRNGTKVNGQRVQTAILAGGDTISIGTTQVRLVLPQQGGKAKKAAEAIQAENPLQTRDHEARSQGRGVRGE
jgi:pSer/pThr/pTyr-binding forkhead associated (FHA) protein